MWKALSTDDDRFYNRLHKLRKCLCGALEGAFLIWYEALTKVGRLERRPS